MPLAICRQCETRFVVDRQERTDWSHCPHCGGAVRWVVWPATPPALEEPRRPGPGVPLIAVPLKPDGKPN